MLAGQTQRGTAMGKKHGEIPDNPEATLTECMPFNIGLIEKNGGKKLHLETPEFYIQIIGENANGVFSIMCENVRKRSLKEEPTAKNPAATA